MGRSDEVWIVSFGGRDWSRLMRYFEILRNQMQRPEALVASCCHVIFLCHHVSGYVILWHIMSVLMSPSRLLFPSELCVSLRD